jgi:hypothetical protein
MKTWGFLLAFMVGIMTTPLNVCADISVSLTLDREEATPSDAVRMVVSVSGARKCDAPPVIDGLDDFRVTQGGSSSRVEIINGAVRSGIDYTYYLAASAPATYRIGPARVQVDGDAYESNAASLTIVKGRTSESSAGGPISLTATLSSNQAYVEEPVLYTLRLYLRSRVSDISLQLPEQDHLTFQQLGTPRESQGVMDGRPCQIVEVSYAVMGLKEGNYPIAPARMEMTVYDSGVRRRGFFDDPFFTDPFFRTGRPVTVSSEPHELTVVPLPLKGRPDGYTGLVGNFSIVSELKPAKIRAGESATLTVQVSGRGNVHRIPDLELPAQEHIKIYADQPVFAPGHDLKGLAGSKIMKWAVVPELPGDYQIPPLSVSFFDPKTGEYRVIRTQEHPLAVIPGKGKMLMVEAQGTDKGGDRGTPKEAVQEIGRDILPLHTSVRDMGTRAWLQPRSAVWAFLLFLPAFVYLAAFVGLRFRKRSVQTLPAHRAKRAAGTLIRQCRKTPDADAEALHGAVRGYVNDRFGLTLASLTPVDAVAILTSQGVHPDTARRFGDALQEMEDAIYAGTDRTTVKVAETLPDVVRAIERDLR